MLTDLNSFGCYNQKRIIIIIIIIVFNNKLTSATSTQYRQ